MRPQHQFHGYHQILRFFFFFCFSFFSFFLVVCYVISSLKESELLNTVCTLETIQHMFIFKKSPGFAGYAHNGQGEEALKLHSLMMETGTRPDHSTMVVILTACSLLASLQQGRQAHAVMVKCGFELNVSVCNTLITMYSKCGSIHESESVFRQIHGPDLVSWNTVIAAYAQHGHYEEALGLFDEMTTNGLKPDGITFLSVLSACGHAGKVKESMDWFSAMVEDFGVTPRAEHYSCLVDILSRAGQLERAYDFIRQMPFEADGAVWGALLGACRVHLNVELGKLAAKKLVELDPHNSGAYVMLSNIYAAAGMWREVTRVRGLMKEQGIKKQPGYSWMEIGSQVHLFSGGGLHPEIDRIHLELERISLHMKINGDVEDKVFM